MKNATIGLILFLAVFLLACGSDTPEQPTVAAQPTQPQAQQPPAADEPAMTEEEAEKMTPEEREGYIKKVEAELKQIDDHAAALKEKAKQGGSATADATRKALDELDQQRKVAAEKLKVLKEASKSAGSKAWAKSKKATDDAVTGVKKAYDKVKSLF